MVSSMVSSSSPIITALMTPISRLALLPLGATTGGSELIVVMAMLLGVLETLDG